VPRRNNAELHQETGMFVRLLDCVTVDHNPLLVGLAVIVALFSGFTFFRVLGHTRLQAQNTQIGWSLMAALVAGGGIWATHFIAMLGFRPGPAVSYDVGLTLMSGLQAIVFACLATLLLLSRSAIAALAGALVLGVAIGTMHFTGMRALVFSGSFEWDPGLVTLSLSLGIIFAVASIFMDRRDPSLIQCLAAATLFGVAVCSLHFTAMEAAVFRTDPAQPAVNGNLSKILLALTIALVAGSIVVFSLVTVMFDRRARRATADAARTRSILESSQTGILLCHGETIVTANKMFCQLAGLKGSIEGRLVSDFLNLPVPGHPKARLCDQEARLKTENGVSIDVAVCATPVQHDGAPRYLIELRDISDQKRSQGQILHLANHDALTGLPNRRLLNTELHGEAATSQEFALLWIDLDHFKKVNDEHDHAIGDALLCEVTRRLRLALEERHLLARIGGDEFVVLFRSSPGRHDPAKAAENLVHAMAHPFVVEGRQIQVGASIGLARYPADAASAEDLMRKADAALYDAKRSGRSRWRQAA
jgi:diguanylate cyclase (GGDEF)-like protein